MPQKTEDIWLFLENQRKPAGTMRRIGRPRHGRVLLTQERIDSLPDIGNSDQILRALGIALGSLQGWRRRKVNPVPFKFDDQKRALFEKVPLVRWLIITRRYRPKPDQVKKWTKIFKDWSSKNKQSA